MLVTKRLVLRDFALDDWQAIQEFAGDLETVRFLSWGPNSEQDTKSFIARCLCDQGAALRLNYEFAILLNDQLIGGIGLNLEKSNIHQADLGFCLNKRFWKRGLAAEACLAILQFGFDTLGLTTITANSDPENSASLKLLEKLGFKRVREAIGDIQIRGEWRNSVYFELIKDTLSLHS